MNTRLLAVVILVTCFFSMQQGSAQNTSPYWSLAGNANATSTSKLGTTTGINLRLYTNNSERMRITTAGLVGIGTTAPTERLHVNSASGANAFRAQVNGATKLLVHSGGGVAVGANVTPPINGLYVSGNVGIGSSNPTAKLHVVGTSRFTSNLTVANGGLNATNTSGTGIAGTGSGTGVYGSTDGAEATDIGVYGVGYGYGVKGGGFFYGVYGSGGIGVYGLGDGTGIQGKGYDYGVYGESSLYGVYGSGYDVGVAGYATNSYGVYGATGNSDSYAGYFAGNVYATGTFTPSARTLKQNITDLNSALAIISKLRPKEYEYKQDGAFTLMNLPRGKRYGLIAEDVEQVLPGLVKATEFDAKGPQRPDSAGRKTMAPVSEKMTFKALNYTELIPILVKGMQELDAKTSENEQLTAQVDDLTRRVARLEALLTKGSISERAPVRLGEAMPNPANSATRISYTLATGSHAQLLLTDAEGKTIRSISLHGSGSVNINTTSLSSGVYNYSLYVDGKQVDTKRLVITR